MKKLILLLILVSFSLSSSAQRSDSEWFASVGINAINSLGTQSPINSPGDWANGLPISLGVEVGWTSGLSIEQSLTLNKFAEGDEIDGVELDDDFAYTSFDTHVKYYFGKHIFPKADWLDFYGNAGIGIFAIDDTNISANIGGGVLVWLNRRQTIGIRAQAIAKFALNHKDSGLANNHYQTHLQLVFAL